MASCGAGSLVVLVIALGGCVTGGWTRLASSPDVSIFCAESIDVHSLDFVLIACDLKNAGDSTADLTIRSIEVSPPSEDAVIADAGEVQALVARYREEKVTERDNGAITGGVIFGAGMTGGASDKGAVAGIVLGSIASTVFAADAGSGKDAAQYDGLVPATTLAPQSSTSAFVAVKVRRELPIKALRVCLAHPNQDCAEVPVTPDSSRARRRPQ